MTTIHTKGPNHKQRGHDRDDPIQVVKRRLDDLSKRTYHPAAPLIYGQKPVWYYPYGFREVKNWRRELVVKLFVDGPFTTKQEADHRLAELELDMGDIHESEHRDPNRAKKEIAEKLNEQHKLAIEVATQRKYRG